MNNNNKKILNEVDLLSLGLGAAAAGGAAYLGKKALDAYRRRQKEKANSPEAIEARRLEREAAKRASEQERQRKSEESSASRLGTAGERAARTVARTGDPAAGQQIIAKAQEAEDARSRSARIRPGEGHDVIPGTSIKLTAQQIKGLDEHGRTQRGELVEVLRKLSIVDPEEAKKIAAQVRGTWVDHPEHGYLPHGQNGLVERSQLHGRIMGDLRSRFPQIFQQETFESYSNNLSTNDPSVKMLMERFNYYLRN